jgi:xylulokinase
MEGVTFGLKYAVGALQRSGVQPAQLTLVGGGAASDGWAQLCADIFRLPLVRAPQVEAAALGAARQARWAVDNIPVGVEAISGRQFEPVASPGLEAAERRSDQLRELAIRNSL